MSKKNFLLTALVLSIGIIAALILVSFTTVLSNNRNWNSKDVQAIRQTALDYVEGWYEGNAQRMGRALHPKMVKRYVENPNSESILHELDFSAMLSMTNTRSGARKNVSNNGPKITVTILDINNNIATVKIESDFIDYLHVAKFNNQWSIINVLWDYK